MINSIVFESPIGNISITCSSAGIRRVTLGTVEPVTPLETPIPEILIQAIGQFKAYFENGRKKFDLPIDWSEMTQFQKEVLVVTDAIPFGQVMTYGQIAKQLNKPLASRAVGAALGSNSMPILIPCHRVVGADGNLTGYSGPGGIRTKQTLLELEGRQVVRQKLV
jgi:methylated-DNA-[protein]-cysteine S-methyltransferase